MSYVTELVCVQCGASYREGQADTCPACGADEGILDVRFDLASAGQSMTREALAGRPLSIWRYRELLPVDWPVSESLEHIGWTPLIESPRLAHVLDVGRLRLKDEGRSASGSFKDRASAIGTARAMAEGKSELACASTGNAATSLAYCGAAAGFRVNIFVSSQIPEGKLAQLLAYGARVFRVAGSYAQAYDLCTQACEEYDWYNRSAAVNPYLVEGKKTGGLELAEQCADDPPDWVVCSVGDGCSIAGVHKGLVQMRELELIDWSAKMLGVQAAGVAPIMQAFESGKLERRDTGKTYADSINVAIPRNWRKAVNAVRESGGAYVTVTDDQIREAVVMTGRLSGVFAEPAAAAAVAGVNEARRQGVIDADASVAIMVTGNGLKDVPGALSAVGGPYDIGPTMAEVEKIVQ